MAMLSGGADSGVETENESNDVDIVNVNVINDHGDPILDLPDSGPSSAESDLNHQLGAVGSSFLGSDGGPSILLGIKVKGDDPPPPPPPTSPNICGTGSGTSEFDDASPVIQNFSADSLDGMIDETDDDLHPSTSMGGQSHVNINPVLSSPTSHQSSHHHNHQQSINVLEDEIMERDEVSDEEECTVRNAINHERPSNNGEFGSPSKRFLSDIPEPADCTNALTLF